MQPHWYYVGFGLSRSANDAVWIRPKSEPIEDDDEYGIEFSFRYEKERRKRKIALAKREEKV